MDKAVTIGMIVEVMLVVGGGAFGLWLLFWVLDLLNPFRSGH